VRTLFFVSEMEKRRQAVRLLQSNMDQGSLILLVCVHYRRPDDTLRFVESALQQVTRSEVRVVVVDNSPSPSEFAAPAQVHSSGRARVLIPPSNAGYFGAASIALRDHLASNRLPTWLIVSNPDIGFSDQGVLGRLADLHHGSEPSVLAPSILSTITGVDQNPLMRTRPSRFRMQAYRWLFSNYLTDSAYQGLSSLKRRAVARRRNRQSRPPTVQPEAIYAPHGSFIGFHQSYFERGGTLEHGAFLFGEEIFVAETARRLQLTVLYEPRVTLTHAEHSSVRGLLHPQTAQYRKEAARYVAKTFF
jgi:GT2 family glycosyltransferase